MCVCDTMNQGNVSNLKAKTTQSISLKLNNNNSSNTTLLWRRRSPIVIVAASASSSSSSSPSSGNARLRLDNLGPQPGSRKKAKRKGRGHAAGQGGSCGFGMRGQKSRSGPGVRRGFEGGQMPLYRRLPKLRGIAGGIFTSI